VRGNEYLKLHVVLLYVGLNAPDTRKAKSTNMTEIWTVFIHTARPEMTQKSWFDSHVTVQVLWGVDSVTVTLH